MSAEREQAIEIGLRAILERLDPETAASARAALAALAEESLGLPPSAARSGLSPAAIPAAVIAEIRALFAEVNAWPVAEDRAMALIDAPRCPFARIRDAAPAQAIGSWLTLRVRSD
jgi:hypothetical protein